VVAVLVVATSVVAGCGGGPDPTSQQLGGPAVADLSQAWDVQLEVVEVDPPAIVVDEPNRSRTYEFDAGECPERIEVEVADGQAAPVAEDLAVETDQGRCIGSATLEVAGGTVRGVPFVQVDETTFAMAYEATVPCLDDAGAPVGELAQHHELVWRLEAVDAPDELRGELERTIRTDPGCAPPAGQETATVERLLGTPRSGDDA
jgi:hypothetical protein